MPRHFAIADMPRISLRSALVSVAVVALAIVSLRYASARWEAIILSFTAIVFFAMVIVALVGRGARQAFAIGMAVVMAGYLAVKLLEPRPTSRHVGLPTTYLLVRLQSLSGDIRYFDSRTGREVEGYNPAAGVAARTGLGVPTVYASTVPLLENFLRVGHCWWALLLGYVGGVFGRQVYSQRIKVSNDKQ
jgi:hypothetical protein